jgi:LysM repeat protein
VEETPTRRPTRTPTDAPDATATRTPADEPAPDAPDATATRTPADEPAPDEDADAATPQTYTVEEGDTLSEIAEQFEVSLDDLLEANDLTSDDIETIRPGDELRIP